ncbi:MAG TPA: GNAT family N-acetyltransferase [Acidimicrobiales bacterium]|nr:GNAT family N-acetyltransferase [Acidimicrobiales bacterium]
MPTPSGIAVEEVRVVDPELLGAMTDLLPQLSASAPPPAAADLQAIVDSPATVLFAARDEGGRVVGSLTLALFRVPTGMRAWIEDVVVDGGTRGLGVGAALVEAALERAGSSGARTVDLTSRPSREDANRLYQRLGFETRQTNVYRWSGPS